MRFEPPSAFSRMWRANAALFALALFAALAMWAPAFLAEEHSGWGDWQQMHHWAEIGVVSLTRFGEWPLWDPYHCGGVPHWGQPQVQNFSPFWLLLHVPFGTHLGHKLWIVFHHVVGFAGLYIVSRRLQHFSHAGAFLAASIWTMSGFAAWHFAGGHATFLAFMWYPALLLCWRRADDDIRYVVAVAMIMAELLLEGAHYAFPYAAVFLGYDSVSRFLRFEKDAWKRMLRTGVFSVVLTLLLGAVRWVPIMLAMSRYPRPIEDTDTLTFAEVVVMWTARSHDWTWAPHPWVWAEYGTYVGWGVLLLCALGIAIALRERKLLEVGGALFFLAFTMGYHGPFWPSSILHSLPFFSNLHLPSRWQVLCTFYMSLLAGLALTRLEARLARVPLERDTRWVGPLIPWAIAAVLVVDLDVMALTITNRWDGPRVGNIAAEAPHLVHPGNYHGEYSNYPARNVGTTECYDAVPWPRSHSLWVGDVPQVRFADRDGHPRVGDTLHAFARTNHTVRVDVEMQTEGRILINQNFENQWHASVGRAFADEGRLALILPAGRHQVTFRFEPDDLPYSAFASLTGLVVSVVVLVAGRRRRL